MSDIPRTSILTVEQQMADYIQTRRDDRDFCWRLQHFLHDEGAVFDLPIVVADTPTGWKGI